MTHDEFVKQFSSIPESNDKVCILTPVGWAIVETAVRKFCLDKKKVKDLLDKYNIKEHHPNIYTELGL